MRRRVFFLLLLLLLGLALLAAPASASAKGRGEGVISQLPSPANIGDIAAGRHGEFWFLQVKNRDSIGWFAHGFGRTHLYPLPKGVAVTWLAVGREASAWFTYTRGFAALGLGGGGIGRVTEGGEITLFPEPPNPAGGPFEIILGPDGNLWYDHGAAFATGLGTIGRITPGGEVTEFGAGLLECAEITNLVAGADGDVWFADKSQNQGVGRITPSGEILESSGVPRAREYSFLTGPAPAGPGRGAGGAWFSANGPGPFAVERIDADGRITRFRHGLAPNVVGLGPFIAGTEGDAWFRVERHAGEGTVPSPDGRVAIGQVTAAGKITEYARCLRPMQGFEGPEDFVRGPEGGIWFATRTSGSAKNFNLHRTASVGRITPSGRITEFRYGLYEESEPQHLTWLDGRLWFVDSHDGRISWIRPLDGPPNSFLMLSLKDGNSVHPAIELTVPGPGRLRLEELGHRAGLGSSRATASVCGPTTIAVPMRAPVVRAFRRHGVVDLRARVTFTPRGGTPFGETVKIEVGGEE